MDQPQSKADLIATVRSVRADLDALVVTAGEEGLTEPATFGPWSFKDMIAHLTGWRWYSVARIEAAASGQAPVSPWPDFPEPDEAPVDEVNAVIYTENRDRPAAEVLADSQASFDRLEAAVAALPEDALFEPGRYPWLAEWPLAAVITGMAEHFHEEHEPQIRAWLAQR